MPAKTTVWSTLKTGFQTVFKREHMSPGAYMKHYTDVYGYCTDLGAFHGTLAGPTGLLFIGEDLYREISAFMSAYIKEVRGRGAELHGEDLLKFYTEEWENFKFSAKVVDGICAYLNRHWIKREIDEKREEIFSVYVLALVLWKRELFKEHEEKLVDAMLQMIHSERTGNPINNRYISSTIESMVAMGVEEPEELKDEEKGLSLYKKSFESKFLELTRTFYLAESAEFLGQGGNVSDYMLKVENRLQQETNRCQLYLHSSTMKPLSGCAELVLISNQLQFLQSHFGKLLAEQRDDDLGRMYRLCEKVENGLNQLRLGLQNHIIKEGYEAVEKVTVEAANDPKLYVNTLLEVHKRYEHLVKRSFENDHGFFKSLDKASQKFMNRNAVTEKASAATQTHKSAELVAKYADLLLKKSSKMPEEGELEILLCNVMQVFKYIEDKDVFAKFYTRLFSKRLINELSASDEAEASFITKLKEMCGYEYTSRLSKMINDTQVSKDLIAEFKEKKAHMFPGKSAEINVMVLSSGSWPTFSTAPINLPKELSSAVEAFSQYYSEKFTGRRLNWAFSQSRGEITASVYTKKYVFMATTGQMCTLLLFNDQLSYTVEQICEAIKMDTKAAMATIGSLLKNQVLRTDTDLAPGKEHEVPMGAVITINKKFASKKVRVDLSKVTARQESVRDSESVASTVDEDRKWLISACIVRVLKTRKRIAHTLLMTEVIAQMSQSFNPTVPMIKKCIGSLIDKGYMARDAEQSNVYDYIA